MSIEGSRETVVSEGTDGTEMQKLRYNFLYTLTINSLPALHEALCLPTGMQTNLLRGHKVSDEKYQLALEVTPTVHTACVTQGKDRS